MHSSSSSNSGSSSGRVEPTWAVQVENLSYTYPDGTPALRGVDLRIGEGEAVGIVGPNGAGKTTLLLHLNGILQGTGTVRIRGLELVPGRLKEIRRQVGLVFQNPDDQLFLPRVFDDVAFGPLNLGFPRREVESRVRRALASVGMESALYRSTMHLSEGEKKRVAIATVLAYGPSILVFDEPTANLDPRQRRALLDWMRESGKTLVVASHDLDFVAALAERLVVLDSGRVRAEGLAGEILADETLMREYGLERLRTPGEETRRSS